MSSPQFYELCATLRGVKSVFAVDPSGLKTLAGLYFRERRAQAPHVAAGRQ